MEAQQPQQHSKGNFSKEILLPDDDVFEDDPFASVDALATDHARTLSGAECVIHSDVAAPPNIHAGGGRDWFSERRLSAGAEEDEDNDFDNCYHPVKSVMSSANTLGSSIEKSPSGDKSSKVVVQKGRTATMGETGRKRFVEQKKKARKAKQEYDFQDLSKAAREILPFAFSKGVLSESSFRTRSTGHYDDHMVEAEGATPVSMDAWDSYPLKALLTSVSDKLQRDRSNSISRSRAESFFCGRLSETYNGFMTPSSSYDAKSIGESKSPPKRGKEGSGASSPTLSNSVAEQTKCLASVPHQTLQGIDNRVASNEGTAMLRAAKQAIAVGDVSTLIPYKMSGPGGKLEPIALPLTSPATALTANIEKFSPSFGRGWQWRFFELREAECELVYWEDESLAATEQPRGRIGLKTVSRIYANNGTSIILNVPGRDYRLRFITPGQKDAWLDVLDVAIYNSRFQSTTTKPTPTTDLPTDMPPHSGAPETNKNSSAVASPTESPPLFPRTDDSSNDFSVAAGLELYLKRDSVTRRRDSIASLPSWSSFVEDWVVRPLKITGSKTEQSAFGVQELTMKKSFLLAKGLLHPLKLLWRDASKEGNIVDMRRYVPNLPEGDSNKLTQLAELCASAKPGEPDNHTARLWASFLNICCDDMIPVCLPPRYRVAVAWLQLIKGHPSSTEEYLNNVLAGYMKFGRQLEGLSDIEMKPYFGLMICTRPVANGKVQDCRDTNLSFSSLTIGSNKDILLHPDNLYLFDCSFSDSLPIETIDLKHCWEIKRVKETSSEFEWSVKEPPHGSALRFSCTTYRDASQWRMAQVMAKLSYHSEKERGLVLRHLYNSSPAAY